MSYRLSNEVYSLDGTEGHSPALKHAAWIVSVAAVAYSLGQPKKSARRKQAQYIGTAAAVFYVLQLRKKHQ